MAIENNRIFQFIELQYDKLSDQINNWLSTIYNRSELQYNISSPYGQLLAVAKELFTHNIIYLKNAVEQINVDTSVDTRTIRYIARIAGHNPSRAVSASGVLKLKLKSSINIFEELNSNSPRLIIRNKTRIKNNTNSLEYVVNLGTTDTNIYSLTPGVTFYLNVLQGKWETQTYTGDGSINQSWSVNVNNNLAIDNFNYKVFYNGIQLKIVDHYYDMLPTELACVARTGFNGGIDLYFGNGDYGFIPREGSRITIEYLLTSGVAGDILNPLLNDWKFIDNITDGEGNNVTIEDLFDIDVAVSIGFSSNGESALDTKTLIPKVSRNFVLATPDQFIYHLSKLNIFKQVDAFNQLEDNDFSSYTTNKSIENQITKLKRSIDEGKNKTDLINIVNNIQQSYNELWSNTNDNIIYLFLIPRIDKYLNSTTNYFNLPLDVFYLDESEKERTINYLRSQGNIGITTEIRIIQPVITKYICNIFVNRFEDSSEDNVKQQIIDILSTFFLNTKRTDRIVKSDIILELKNTIKDIDSIDVYFISEKNENYHKSGMEKGLKTDPFNVGTYDPNVLIGIDPIHGDILINKDEYPIIRGGWSDRNGIYFNENPNYKGLNSININFGKIINR